MEKRKVRVAFTHGYDSEKKEPIKSEGYFHEWGIDYEEYQSPVEPWPISTVQHSVGIVEDESGKIHLVHPSNIQFL